MTSSLVACLTVCVLAAPRGPADAEAEAPPAVARDDQWPDRSAAERLSGELTHVDHVNRTCILRPDRIGSDPKDTWDLPHDFTLPPYGRVRRHGADADLLDVPLGVHLHVSALRSPPGDGDEFEKDNRVSKRRRAHRAEFDRALLIEDDFSFHTRLGLAWTVAAVDRAAGVLEVDLTDADGRPAEPPEGEPTVLAGRQRFHLGPEAGVYVGDRIGDADDLQPGQTVQMNFSWVSVRGTEAGVVRDVWVDGESRALAARRQTRVHRAALERHGLPGRVTATTHPPGGGNEGTLTVELYAGPDEELLSLFETEQGLRVYVAEHSLRTYDTVNDPKVGHVTAVDVDPDPPFGSSGVRLEMKCYEMLEGYRPGRTVRVQVPGASVWERPREERLWPRDVRVLRAGWIDPTLRTTDLSADPP